MRSAASGYVPCAALSGTFRFEARDFPRAVETKEALFPTFQDGLQVSRVIAALFRSHQERRRVRIAEF